MRRAPASQGIWSAIGRNHDHGNRDRTPINSRAARIVELSYISRTRRASGLLYISRAKRASGLLYISRARRASGLLYISRARRASGLFAISRANRTSGLSSIARTARIVPKCPQTADESALEAASCWALTRCQKASVCWRRLISSRVRRRACAAANNCGPSFFHFAWRRRISAPFGASITCLMAGVGLRRALPASNSAIARRVRLSSRPVPGGRPRLRFGTVMLVSFRVDDDTKRQSIKYG